MKRSIAIFASALLLFMSATALVSCDKKEESEKKVMNLSLNPSVEFVLDSEDKVVSVNALNEEGNLVVSAETFVGKDADEAAKLFVEVSKETGFLVSGSAQIAGNEINVSFSGDTKEATALYNEVKEKVDGYLSEENITATIKQAAAITEEQLEKLVAECAPYMEEAEVKALEYMELVETLYESRKETAEFYSQELKNAYYEAKAFVLEQAELETLKEKVSGVAKIALDAAYTLYSDAVSGIETLRMETLVNEDSAYQKVLKAFREAKIQYLNYRAEVAEMEQTEVTEAVLQQLANYEKVVEAQEETLLSAGETANKAIDSAKAQMKTAYEAVVKLIEEAAVKANDFLGEISTKQQTAKEQFFTDFETSYANAISAAKNNWNAMKENLKGEEPQA